MSSGLRNLRVLPALIMPPSLRSSRRGYPPKFSSAVTVLRTFWLLSPPGKRRPGFFTGTISSYSSSSIIKLGSPSSNNSQDHITNPSLAHRIRVLTSHKHLVHLHPCCKYKRKPRMESLAKFTAENVTTVAKKAIGQITAHRSALVPNVVGSQLVEAAVTPLRVILLKSGVKWVER
jgi:hypothetical protein